jgi:hypothetical protein
MPRSNTSRQQRPDRGRWIRFYERLLHSPKIIRLTDHQFRAWISVLCSADANSGRVLSAADLAIIARLTAKDCEDLLNDLVEARLIDPVVGPENHCLVVHDWHHWQYKSDVDPTNADRQKRFRRKRKTGTPNDVSRASNALRNAPVTLLEAEAEEYRCQGKNTNPVSRLVSSSTTEQEARGSENRIQHTHDTITDDGEVVS